MSLNSPPEVVPRGLAPVLQEGDLDVASYETCMDNPFFLMRGREIVANPRVLTETSPASGNVAWTHGSGDGGEREEGEGTHVIPKAALTSEVIMETCILDSRESTKEVGEADNEIIAPSAPVDLDDPSLELVEPPGEITPPAPPPEVQVAMMVLLHCLNNPQKPTEGTIQRESLSRSTAGSGVEGANGVVEERTLESVSPAGGGRGAEAEHGGEEHPAEMMDTGEQSQDTEKEEGAELMERDGNGVPPPASTSEPVVGTGSQQKEDCEYLEDGQVLEEEEDVEVGGDKERAMEADQQEESQSTDSQPAQSHDGAGEETDGAERPRQREQEPASHVEEQSREEGGEEGKDGVERKEGEEEQGELERSNHGDTGEENDMESTEEQQDKEAGGEGEEKMEIADGPVDEGASQDSSGVSKAPPSGRVSEALPNGGAMGGVSNGGVVEGVSNGGAVGDVSNGGAVGGVSDRNGDDSLDSDLEAFMLTPPKARSPVPPDQVHITAFHLLKWREELDGSVCNSLNDGKLKDLIRAANWYSPTEARNGEEPVTMAMVGDRTTAEGDQNRVFSFIPSWSLDLVSSGKGKAPLDKPSTGRKTPSKYSSLKLAPPAQHNGQPSQNTESDDALIYDSAGSEGPSPTPGITLEPYESDSKSDEEQILNVEESETHATTDLRVATDSERRAVEQRDQGTWMEVVPSAPPAPRPTQKDTVLDSMEDLTCEETALGPESAGAKGVHDEGLTAEGSIVCSPDMFSQYTEGSQGVGPGSQGAGPTQQSVSRGKEEEGGDVDVVGETETEEEHQTMEESFVDVTGGE